MATSTITSPSAVKTHLQQIFEAASPNTKRTSTQAALTTPQDRPAQPPAPASMYSPNILCSPSGRPSIEGRPIPASYASSSKQRLYFVDSKPASAISTQRGTLRKEQSSPLLSKLRSAISNKLAKSSPNLKKVLGKRRSRPPLFGGDIQDLLEYERSKYGLRDHPLPLQVRFFIDYLLSPFAINTEGLFRVPASKNDVDALRAALNRSRPVDFLERAAAGRPRSPLLIADLLKLWVREIPGSLVPPPQFAELLAIVADIGPSGTMQPHHAARMRAVVDTLPAAKAEALKALCVALNAVSCRATDGNQMTARNIAVCFGPNLTAFAEARVDALTGLITTTAMLIEYAPALFGESDAVLAPFALPDDAGQSEASEMTLSVAAPTDCSQTQTETITVASMAATVLEKLAKMNADATEDDVSDSMFDDDEDEDTRGRDVFAEGEAEQERLERESQMQQTPGKYTFMSSILSPPGRAKKSLQLVLADKKTAQRMLPPAQPQLHQQIQAQTPPVVAEASESSEKKKRKIKIRVRRSNKTKNNAVVQQEATENDPNGANTPPESKKRKRGNGLARFFPRKKARSSTEGTAQ